MLRVDARLLTWRKSSYSAGNGGSCVEVGGAPGVVGVRDTKDRAGGTLAFAPGRWRTFVAGLKANEFRP